VRRSAVAIALVTCAGLVACGAFGTATPTTTNADAAADAPAVEAAGDGGLPCAADASNCVLFSDDFTRASPDNVIGAWDGTTAPEMLSIGSGSAGQALRARALGGTGQRGGWLEKRFSARSGIRLSFSIQQSRPAGSAFGSGVNDYCEFVVVTIGKQYLAILFTYESRAGFFLYDVTAQGGQERAPTNIYPEPTEITMTLAWSSTNVTLDGTIGGAAVSSATASMNPSLASQEVALQFGTRCTGTTPEVQATLDTLVVSTYP
jgi:hypothetical protein